MSTSAPPSVGQPTRKQILLAQVVWALLIVFVLIGAVWHGVSGEVLGRIWHNLIERPGGPMTFRFILQPSMAVLLAVIDGIRDARSGAPPYFWSLVTGSTARLDRLFDGVIATSRVLLLGLVMDVAYQLIVFKTFYPGEAAIVAVLLAFVPYLLLRGPFARLARMWGVRASSRDGQA